MRLEDSTELKRIHKYDCNDIFRRANTQSKKKRLFNKFNDLKIEK